MTTKSQRILICGGNFNNRHNLKMDSSNGKSEPKKVSKRINTLMQEMGIVDDGERLTQWVKTTLSTLSLSQIIVLFYMLVQDHIIIQDQLVSTLLKPFNWVLEKKTIPPPGETQ